MQFLKRLRLDRAMIFVGLYAFIQFFYTWWIHSHNPIWRVGIDAGWYGWSDQLNYLRIAQVLAQGKFPSPLLYGPGYPIVAVPFLTLVPSDPFLLPDFFLYIATLLICFRIARTFLSTELSVIAIVILSQSNQFTDFFVVPWSNVLTAFCLALLLWFAASSPRRRWLTAATMGLCIAWTFSARYGDAVTLIPAALLVLFRLSRTWAERLKLSGIALIAAAPLLLWVGAAHTAAFGNPFVTPYELHLDPITGLDEQNLAGRSFTYFGYHLFSILIDPHTFDARITYTPVPDSLADRPLLSYYFVIVLSGIGLAFLGRQNRGLVYSFGLSFILAMLLYGTSWASSANDLQFHALRFFAPWEPMLICAAVAGVAGLLHADWHVSADRRLIMASSLITILFGIGLYGLGRALPPFPDTARLVPTQGWAASASVANKQISAAFDGNVNTGWRPRGRFPVGTYFQIDLRRLYRLDHLFLAQRAAAEDVPVSVGLEISTDGSHWIAPSDLQPRSPEARISEFEFAPTVTRYVRFSLSSESTDAGWAIDEIYAYGVPVSP